MAKNSPSKSSQNSTTEPKKPVTLFGLVKQYFGVYNSARGIKSSVIKDILGDGKVAKVVSMLPMSRIGAIGIGAVAFMFFRKSRKTA